tara:strand:- start:1128 stop:1256 length:129 start_codon:yes stop_codon:yes gene_type:complete
MNTPTPKDWTFDIENWTEKTQLIADELNKCQVISLDELEDSQ